MFSEFNGPRGPQKGRARPAEDTIKYVSEEDWQMLRAVVDVLRDRLIILFLYSTGCRVSELVAARIEDIDWEGGFIRISSASTKTRMARTARVSQEVLSDLKAYLRVQGWKAGRLFRSRGRRSITTRRVQQLVIDYAVRAGIQSVYGQDSKGRDLCAVTAHTLRHSHIVHALARKIPLPAIQKQVGHRRLTTTQVYCNLAPHDVRRAYDEAQFQ